MKRVALFLACGVVGLLAGCGSDGIVFNGVKQVEQFPVRKTPIVHFNLPSEVFDPVTGDASVDVMSFLPLGPNTFTELSSPGHDLWSNLLRGTDVNGDMVEDWYQIVSGDPGTWLVYGAEWPDTAVQQAPYPGLGTVPAQDYIEWWSLSLMNQWFLRDIDQQPRVAQVPGDPPISYEGAGFSSMAISLHEAAAATSPYSPLWVNNTPGVPAQQETTMNTPPGTGLNGNIRVNPPMNNFLHWLPNGLLANDPFIGLLAIGWWEPPAENIHIETIGGGLQRVPAPDYFSAGGFIDAVGGIYLTAYIDLWRGVTETAGGAAPVVDRDDGVLFSYYLAVIAAHQVALGIGMANSSFALPGVVNNQEDIMNESVLMDMTAFIAAGKEFNFVLEDLLRMQDVVNGDFANPGPLSTLPGTDR